MPMILLNLQGSVAVTQVDLPETTSASLGPQVTKPHVIFTVAKLKINCKLNKTI